MRRELPTSLAPSFLSWPAAPENCARKPILQAGFSKSRRLLIKSSAVCLGRTPLLPLLGVRVGVRAAGSPRPNGERDRERGPYLRQLKLSLRVLTYVLPLQGVRADFLLELDGVALGECSSDSLRSAVRVSGGMVTSHRSEEHTSELQSQFHLVCRLLLEKKK